MQHVRRHSNAGALFSSLLRWLTARQPPNGLRPFDLGAIENGCSNCQSTCISGKANLPALVQRSLQETL